MIRLEETNQINEDDIRTILDRTKPRFSPFGFSINMGGMDWWVYALIIWAVIAFIGFFRGGISWGGGYRGYEYGSGGGFFSGLFGAMTGAWLYDMFTGSRYHDSYSRNDDYSDSYARSDNGDVGSSSSSDNDYSSGDSDSSGGDW